MKKMKVLLFIFPIVILAGCSSSQDEELAKKGDWYHIGYQDGIAGLTQRTYKSLAKLGPVKQSDYDIGYIDGVKIYCNPNFAYQIGLSGQMYEGVCEGLPIANKFRMEWQRGWDQYNSH